MLCLLSVLFDLKSYDVDKDVAFSDGGGSKPEPQASGEDALSWPLTQWYGFLPSRMIAKSELSIKIQHKAAVCNCLNNLASPHLAWRDTHLTMSLYLLEYQKVICKEGKSLIYFYCAPAQLTSEPCSFLWWSPVCLCQEETQAKALKTSERSYFADLFALFKRQRA